MDTSIRGYSTQPRWTFPGMIMPFSGTFGGDGGRYPIPLDSATPLTDWVLCDGVETNGFAVPDLRDRMIVCAGNQYTAGSSGGAETHTHDVSGDTDSAGSHSHGDTFSVSSSGSHSHSVSGSVGSTTLTTNQMPRHTHEYSKLHTPGNTWGQGSSLFLETMGNTMSTGGSSSHTHSLSSATTDTDGSHTHSISGSVSSGGAHTHSMSVTSEEASNMSPYYALAYIMCVRAS